MLLVAATTDNLDDSDVVFAELAAPVSGPALVVAWHTLRDAVWYRADGGQRPKSADEQLRVPLWACHLDDAAREATLFATVQWRPDAVVLAAFRRTSAPAVDRAGLTSWAAEVFQQSALVNFLVPRPGERDPKAPETEVKLTLSRPVNPLAVARLLRDHLAATGVPVFGTTVYRRILRSEIYLPSGGSRREYAALTPRPDGNWWAKAKVLKDGRLHKHVRPAVTREQALDLAAEDLGRRNLVHAGQLHRATWDLPSPTDSDGHWSAVTVDTSALAPFPGSLQQVEIEYAACFTAAPVAASITTIRQTVAEVADSVAAVLADYNIPYIRNGQSKIEHFLTAGDTDAIR